MTVEKLKEDAAALKLQTKIMKLDLEIGAIRFVGFLDEKIRPHLPEVFAVIGFFGAMTLTLVGVLKLLGRM